jgi:hypothetical protein
MLLVINQNQLHKKIKKLDSLFFAKIQPVFIKTKASKMQKEAVCNSVDAVYGGRGSRLRNPWTVSFTIFHSLFLPKLDHLFLIYKYFFRTNILDLKT